MDRSIGRIFLFTFIALVVFIFLLVKIFGGHHKSTPNPTTPVVKPLAEYASTDAAVSMTIDGHINGDDQHHAIRITVDKYERTLDILSGYNNNVTEEHTIANNETAYNVFLKSIANEGFVLKRKSSKSPTSEIGQCPLGTRTIFELNNDGDSLTRLWTSSCGSNVGIFGGAGGALDELFQAQITDYNKLITQSKVQL